MIDIESQMLDALDLLYHGLEQPVDGMNDKVRELCLEEAKEQFRRTQAEMILPDPKRRDKLTIRHVLDRGAFPLPLQVMAERYLDLYENAPLVPHRRPIIDQLPTASGIPLARARNVFWEDHPYEANVQGSDLVWAHLIANSDLASRAVADRVFAEHMFPCYEQKTADLGYKLYTRWNLADTMPAYTQGFGGDGIFLALKKDVPARNFLAMLQFFVNTFLEHHSDRPVALKEVMLSFCTDTPADVFAELMPPLEALVIVDTKGQTLLHLGTQPEAMQRMLRFWHRSPLV